MLSPATVDMHVVTGIVVVLQHVSNGIDSVKKIVQEKGIDGVHGPLIENFQCDKQFFTAVEVTAGNK